MSRVDGRRICIFPRWQQNPYLSMLYLAAEADGWDVGGVTTLESLARKADGLTAGDVLHVHWTAPITARAETLGEALERAARFEAVLRTARAHGIHVLWTVHNEVAHDTAFPEAEAAVADALVRHASVVIQLHDLTAEHLADSYTLPQERLATLRHSSYAGVYPELPTREAARRALGVPEDVPTVGLIGQLRPYKGVDVLLAAAEIAAREVPGLTVLLAGKTAPDQIEEIDAMIPAGLPVVRFHEFLDEAEIGTWIQACNVVALPYRRILNSGSALLAATFGRPVALPDDTPLARVYADEKWVEIFEAGDAAVESLARVLVRLAPGDAVREEAALVFARNYSPYDMSRDFLHILDELREGRA
jgi:beta-1,4-mannosyltransferase